MSPAGRLLITSLLLALGSQMTLAAPNWVGDYPRCNRQSDLLKAGPLDIGVRVLTTNPVLERQFFSAMEYWSSVLDLKWHKVDSDDCAIELVDGDAELFTRDSLSARAQLPDQPDFAGWIAFNPALRLTEHELFRLSVHEVGHLLGLGHSRSTESVMYFLDLDEAVYLDDSDVQALAARHQMREDVP